MMSKAREEAVWKRVLALSEEAPEPVLPRPKEPPITALLPELRTAVHTYRHLAGLTGGPVGRCLRRLAEEKRRQVRRLETACYVLTGRRSCAEAPAKPCGTDLREELRRCFTQEIKTAERCRTLAGQKGPFSDFLQQLAEETLCHSQMLLRLLERCL